MFRGEPAIAGFDWPFTTKHRSSERFANHHRFGPPFPFRRISAYPRLDHPASGHIPVIPRSSYVVPLLTNANLLVTLRLPFYGLASPLRYTPWPVLQNVRYDSVPQSSYSSLTRCSFGLLHHFQAVSLYHHLVSGSFYLLTWGTFQLSLTVLLRYRSQDVFSFGGW